MSEYKTLSVDLDLYLAVTRTFWQLEQEEARFSYFEAVRVFSTSDELNAIYDERFDSTPPSDVHGEIRAFVMAIQVVEHHHAELSEIENLEDNLSEDDAKFVRLAAWAFITGWTQRYGAICADLLVGKTIVDPSVRIPS